MALSQYLKLKITADKNIADAFSKGLQGVGNAARENLSDYKNNLEMLYIYIEKVINSFNMKLSGRTSPTEQGIIRLLDGVK